MLPDLTQYSITLIDEHGDLAHILPFDKDDDRYQYMTGRKLGFSAIDDGERKKLMQAYGRALVSGKREEVIYRSDARGGIKLHVDLFRFPPTNVGAIVLSTEMREEERKADRPKLTGRELRVLRLAADDKSDGEIAAELKIAKPTVSRHKQNIREKLGVSEWAGAVAKGVREGLT